MVDYSILPKVKELFMDLDKKNKLVDKNDIKKFIQFLHKQVTDEQKIIVASFYWIDERLISIFGDKTIIINEALPELKNVKTEKIDSELEKKIDDFKAKYSRFVNLVDIYENTSSPQMWIKPQENSSQDSFFTTIEKFVNSLKDNEELKIKINNNIMQFKNYLHDILFDVYNIGSYNKNELNIFYYPCYLGNRIFFDGLFVFKISEKCEDLYSLERILSIFVVNLHLSIRLYFSRLESIKSAVSAIMARNMSHNIGSHVLADLVSKMDINSSEHLNHFYRYLQNRMDFIAQITTDFPDWTYPAYFNKELMRIFYESFILIDRIGVSEGLGAYQWPEDWRKGDMRGKIIVRTCTTQWENGKEKKDTFDWGVNEYHMGDLVNDLQLAIPGGIVGYHAFYIIIENIIRNSAKHDYDARMKESLKREKGMEDEIIFIKFKEINKCSLWVIHKNDPWKILKLNDTNNDETIEKIKSARALIIESSCFVVGEKVNHTNPEKVEYDFILEDGIKLIDDRLSPIIIQDMQRLFIVCIDNNCIANKNTCNFNIENCLVVDKKYWKKKKPHYQLLTEEEFKQLKYKHKIAGNREKKPAERWEERYEGIINFLQKGPLRINIRIDDMLDKDYVWVTIWDNMRHKPSIPFDRKNDELYKRYEVSGEISENDMKKRVLRIPEGANPGDYETVNLFGFMNDRLRQSFIKETGELKREDWGIAELKICAGFLQNRKIEEIGGSGEEIIQYGDNCFNLKSEFMIKEPDSNEGYPRMLIQALPVDKTGLLPSGGVLKENDFYFLGFRFWMKKPKTVLLHGIECKKEKEKNAG